MWGMSEVVQTLPRNVTSNIPNPTLSGNTDSIWRQFWPNIAYPTCIG